MAEGKHKLAITVIKRNGKKVDFDGSKIAVAIKKGFENIVVLNEVDEEKRTYTEKDVNKVYTSVLKRIEKETSVKPSKIELEYYK